MKVGNFNLIFHMTSNYVPPGRRRVLTLMNGCDMDQLEVGNCQQMRCNVNHSELKQLCANKPVKQIICKRSYTTKLWF